MHGITENINHSLLIKSPIFLKASILKNYLHICFKDEHIYISDWTFDENVEHKVMVQQIECPF